MEAKLRCVAIKTDDLGRDFFKGCVYEADDVAMETDRGRYLDCDGTFESLVRSEPSAELFLYPVRDGESLEHAKKFIKEVKEGSTVKLKGNDDEYELLKIIPYGVMLESQTLRGLYRFERIEEIRSW